MQNSLSFNFLWFSALRRSKRLQSNVISIAIASKEITTCKKRTKLTPTNKLISGWSFAIPVKDCRQTNSPALWLIPSKGQKGALSPFPPLRPCVSLWQGREGTVINPQILPSFQGTRDVPKPPWCQCECFWPPRTLDPDFHHRLEVRREARAVLWTWRKSNSAEAGDVWIRPAPASEEDPLLFFEGDFSVV